MVRVSSFSLLEDSPLTGGISQSCRKEGLAVKANQCEDSGMRLLLKRYRKIFRIPENTYYYSTEDYKDAERKFVKYMLRENPLLRLSET